MPIKSKPISEERKRAAAQGRLFSAGARRSAPVDDSSSTSSDDDASHHSAKKATTAVPPKNTNTVFVDPNEDYAVASKRAALQEWLYATGQSVPAPPPKPSTNMQSPAASRTRPTTQAAPAAVTEKVTTPKAQVAELPAAEQSPVKQRTDGHPEPRRTLLNVHEPTPATVPQPPSAPPVVEAVRPPTAAETVTDAEETANPGRREFLKLLDLFDDPPPKKPATKAVPDNNEVHEATGTPAPSEVQSAPTQPSTMHMTIDQLAEYHFDRLYNEWLQSDADVRFIAADEWCRAEAIAVLERAGTTDLASVHQQMRQKDHSLAHGNSYSDNLRRQLTHDAALSRLEEFVVSGPFVRRINQFLHKHHKLFLDTKPARERGEHQHKEYDVWGSYAQVMEQLVVGDLKRNVDGFEEQSFFDKLFEDQEEQDAAATSAPSDTHRRAVAGLSLEAWEVVLSFMRFEHFCDMMDEYISVHYGVVGDGGSSVTGMVSALRRTSPPPTSTTSTSSVPSKSAAATGTARTISTPTVGPTRPSGGVSVKSKVAAPKK